MGNDALARRARTVTLTCGTRAVIWRFSNRLAETSLTGRLGGCGRSPARTRLGIREKSALLGLKMAEKTVFLSLYQCFMALQGRENNREFCGPISEFRREFRVPSAQNRELCGLFSWRSRDRAGRSRGCSAPQAGADVLQ